MNTLARAVLQVAALLSSMLLLGCSEDLLSALWSGYVG